MIRLAVLLIGAAAVLAASGCTDVPVSLNHEVASSLETNFSVEGFRAVRSHDDKDLWFVSGHATYPDGSAHYPVWATKNLSGGPVYTVDLASRDVTQGLDKLQNAPAGDSGMAEAQKCAQEANGGQ